MTEHEAFHNLLVAKALMYHQTIEGEYGCPGVTCPGVQRLVTLLEQWTTTVLALHPTPRAPRP